MDKYEILYENFTTKLNGYSFDDILEKHEAIDEEVSKNIQTICHHFIQDIGAREYPGRLVFPDGFFYMVNQSFDQVKRQMNIYLLPPMQGDLLYIRQQVRHFGTINTFVIWYPQKFIPYIQLLVECVYHFLKRAYTYLKRIYISKFEEWNGQRKKILLNGIYELLETEVEKSNHSKFKQKLWLAVTELEIKTGETGTFYFEFNSRFLESFIEKALKAKPSKVSPFLLVTNLITKTVKDEQTDKYREEKYVFQNALDDLDIRMHDATLAFWQAENLLYAEKKEALMGVNVIAKHQNFLLSVDHSGFNQELALKIVEPIKEQISQIFKENVIEYNTHPLSKLCFKFALMAHGKVKPFGMEIKNVIVGKIIEKECWPVVERIIDFFSNGH